MRWLATGLIVALFVVVGANSAWAAWRPGNTSAATLNRLADAA